VGECFFCSRYQSIAAGARATDAGIIILRAEIQGSQHRFVKILFRMVYQGFSDEVLVLPSVL